MNFINKNNKLFVMQNEKSMELLFKFIWQSFKVHLLINDDAKNCEWCPDEWTILKNSLTSLSAQLLKIPPNIEQENERSIRGGGDTNNSIEIIILEEFEMVLREELFDSVLIYLNPSSDSIVHLESSIAKPLSLKKKREKLRRQENVEEQGAIDKVSEGIVIRVIDEVNNNDQIFECQENLLLTYMKYFSNIADTHSLHSMDISVHCDIAVFDWLIRWIKSQKLNEEFQSTFDIDLDKPKIGIQNIVPLIVSADFLKMDLLVAECIRFFTDNFGDIIAHSQRLDCLTDGLLDKIADNLQNLVLQFSSDEHDHMRSRLFKKLIVSLGRKSPNKRQGHYSTINQKAGFLCSRCKNYVINSLENIPCIENYSSPASHKFHIREDNWSFSKYIEKVEDDVKDWSSTYWLLWGQCHFLKCAVCKFSYSVAQSNCCAFHPKRAIYKETENTSENDRNFMTGFYPCCGTAVGESLKSIGCEYKSHIPDVSNIEDANVYEIVKALPEEYVTLKAFGNETLYNTVIFEIPERNGKYRAKFKPNKPKPREGLFSQNLCDKYRNFCDQRGQSNEPEIRANTSSSTNNEMGIPDNEQSERCDINNKTDKEYRSSTNNYFRESTWDTNYSPRHNQDNQRDAEEITFRNLSLFISQL